VPLDGQSCMQLTVKLGTTLGSVAVAPFTMFSPTLTDALFKGADFLTGADERQTLLGNAAAVEVKAGVTGGPKNALKLPDSYQVEALRDLSIGFRAGGGLAYLAKVGVAASRTAQEIAGGETRFPHLEPSLSFRVGIDLTAGIDVGVEEEKDRLEAEGKQQTAQNVEATKNALRARLGGSFGVSGLLQYAASVDATELPPTVEALTVKRSVPKAWGWSSNLTPISESVGATRTNSFKIKDPGRYFEAMQRIALLGGPGALFLEVPEGGGLPGFEVQSVGQQFAKLFALADEYTESIEHGIGVEKTFELKKFQGRNRGNAAKLDAKLRFDSSVGHDTLRAVLRDGRLYPLEVYREDDPLLPDPEDVGLPDRLLACFGTSTNQVAGALNRIERLVTKGLAAPPTLFSMVLSPSGVDLAIDGAAEPDPQVPLEVSLVGFPYRPLPADALPLIPDPSDTAGDPSRPHYGVGGFFQFDPEDYPLAAPARLVMHYDEALIGALDEQSFRIYAWSPERGDWDYVGGTLDASANTVTADVGALRLFTIAPSMPAGTLDLAAGFEPGAPAPHATTLATYTASGLSRNDGTPVPDGTLYNVYVVAPLDTADLLPVGEITTADADPTAPGVQVASQGGAISFRAELPGAAGEVKTVVFSAEGMAFGEAVTPYPQE
jgi:hypothetical protein